MQTITSRQNPLVARYRDLSRGRRIADGSMLLDGPHLVQEAVAARLAIFDAAFSVAALDLPEQRTLASRLERDGVAVHAVSDHVMEALSPVRAPAGVVAIAARPNWTIEAAFARRPQLVLVGVGIQEPGNVGAIVRAAEAGGGTGVVFAGASADPFGWKALRGSMGSAFRVPIAIAGDAEMVLQSARASGLTVLAAAPRDGRCLFDVDLRGPVAFLLGAEGPGLADELAGAADAPIAIPMQPPVESLNVAVAAALLVYEAFRQRSANAVSPEP